MATAAAPVTAPQIALLYQRAVRKMLPTLPFVLGGNDLRFKLDPNGYADMLRVSLKGSYTLAASCTPAKPEIPHTIVKKFLVDVPGRETPIDISGKMMHVFNLRSNDFGTFPFAGVPANRAGDDANALYATLVDSFPIVESGANDFCLNWIIPFHRSVVDHKRALPVGALDNDVYLEVTPPTPIAAERRPISQQIPERPRFRVLSRRMLPASVVMSHAANHNLMPPQAAPKGFSAS